MIRDKLYRKCNSRAQKKAFIIIFAFVILVTGGLEYNHWNATYGGWANKLVFYGLLIYLFFLNVKDKQCHFRNQVLLMMLLPFFSIINSSLEYSQSIFESFSALLGQFIWVIYFLLHKYKVKEDTILKVFLCVALLLVVIQVVQQFTYPNAPFGTKSESEMLALGATEAAEQRNGLWRFRMHQNAFYTAPILFFLWLKVREKLNIRLVCIVALLFVSVYLTLTRQILVACILAIFLSMFMGKKKMNFSALFFGLLLIVGLYVYYDVLFSSLAEQTKNDADDDNVRLLAASVLWSESIKTPLTFLFGFGLPNGTSDYALHMQQLQSFFGIYTSDVGFIGQIFERGFLYVCVCYYMLYKLFFKLRNRVPLYTRMFVIFTGSMSIMIFPCIIPAQNIVWVMILYVCDLHINKSPLAVDAY